MAEEGSIEIELVQLKKAAIVRATFARGPLFRSRVGYAGEKHPGYLSTFPGHDVGASAAGCDQSLLQRRSHVRGALATAPKFPFGKPVLLPFTFR
jgi:hypothetical protein